jgi:hypothetical protein
VKVRDSLRVAAGSGALLVMAAAPAGPDLGQFHAAWQAFAPTPGLEIRKLACVRLEDPTESACRFERRIGKKWQRWSTMVARDGDHWVLIDAPGPV